MPDKLGPSYLTNRPSNLIKFGSTPLPDGLGPSNSCKVAVSVRLGPSNLVKAKVKVKAKSKVKVKCPCDDKVDDKSDVKFDVKFDVKVDDNVDVPAVVLCNFPLLRLALLLLPIDTCV